jgi:hypothetical protein
LGIYLVTRTASAQSGVVLFRSALR